jgi:hypothetical protein
VQACHSACLDWLPLHVPMSWPLGQWPSWLGALFRWWLLLALGAWPLSPAVLLLHNICAWLPKRQYTKPAEAYAAWSGTALFNLTALAVYSMSGARSVISCCKPKFRNQQSIMVCWLLVVQIWNPAAVCVSRLALHNSAKLK